MKFYTLRNEQEIKHTIKEIKSAYRSFSEIILPNVYDTTLGGKQVLTIYIKFEPQVKVEGDKDLIDAFAEEIKAEIKKSKCPV